MSCSKYTVLHENKLGFIGYCFGCEIFHLKMGSLLSVVSDEQLERVHDNLKCMKYDLESNLAVEDVGSGIQIKITQSTFLCLSYSEVKEGIELIRIGQYMKKIKELVT